MIENLIKETIEESIKNYFQLPQLYMNKREIAKYIGVSESTVDRLIASDILKDGVHYHRLNDRIMFYVKAVQLELQPRGYHAYFSKRQEESNLSKF